VATSKGGTSFYWVERAESGKGSSFRAPDSFARRSPRVIVKPGQPGAPNPTRT
jgi:hypothetical protein